MSELDVIQPIAVARTKTEKVQEDIRAAGEDLHEANEQLADTAVGHVVTRADVQAALAQNQQVEEQLQEAVKELKVVTRLLKVAEAGKSEAGARSGQGSDSVIPHLRAQDKSSGKAG